MCKSVLFWRVFPWSFTFSLIVMCHLNMFFVTMRVFAEFENAVFVGLTWLQSVFISLAIGWFLQDPVVVIVRNNIKCTKKRIRSKAYQVVEKFIVQPFRLTLNWGVSMFSAG